MRLPSENHQKPFLLLFMSIVLTFSCCGCSPESGKDAVIDRNKNKWLKCDDFLIPLFDTPAQQFNYTKSLFQNRQHKETALIVLINHFPNAINIKGEAELELAYMILGNDFRHADKALCTKALGRYKRIVSEYANVPSICASAMWSMAWIHTDLLQEKRKGIRFYRSVVERYPDETFTRISPVPWLGLIFKEPREAVYPADDIQAYGWASLSLLEIVRNSDGTSEKRAAFDTLHEDYRLSLSFGYALLEMLKTFQPLDQVELIVQQYIKINTANHRLNTDLQSALKNYLKAL